jgi:hypothetical protein
MFSVNEGDIASENEASENNGTEAKYYIKFICSKGNQNISIGIAIC